MKYLSYNLTIATLLLVLTSCRQEGVDTAMESTPVEFHISLPGELQTRSDEDASESLLKWSVFEIKEGEPKRLVESDQRSVTLAGNETSLPIILQLMQGHEYQVAFAVVNAERSFAIFEDGVIKVNYEGVSSNAESDDIFIGKSSVLTVTGESVEESIELHRPFAQLNWSTSDLNLEQVNKNINGISATVSVTGDIYKSLDIIDDTYADKIEGELTFSAVTLSAAIVPMTEEPAYSNIATNYLLIKDAEEQPTLYCKLHFSGHTDVIVDVNNAPAKPNFRTNILGALLTNSKAVSVTMEKGFANNRYNGITDNDIIENILAGEDIIIEEGKTVDLRKYSSIRLKSGQKLIVNGTLQMGDTPLILGAGAKVTVNGTIIFGDGGLKLESGEPVVIDGTGTVSLAGSIYKRVEINSGTELRLENVTISRTIVSSSSEYAFKVDGGKLNAEGVNFNVECGMIVIYNKGSVDLKRCRYEPTKYSYYLADAIFCVSGEECCFEDCIFSTKYTIFDIRGNCKVTVKGDNGIYTITNSSIGAIFITYSYGPTFYIEGGKFKSNMYVFRFSKYFKLTMTGGFFNKHIIDTSDSSEVWKDSWIPDGYEYITNSTAYSGYPYEVRKVTVTE